MKVSCHSALEAVASIQSNEYVWTHSMGATPRVLLDALAQHALSLTNVTLLQLHTERAESLTSPALLGHLKHRCYFVSHSTRPLVNRGEADYVPIFLSDVPKLFRSGEQVVNTALIQVSPPDRHGMCSLGVSVEATKAAIEVTDKVIAHINPQMPRTHGDSFININRFDSYFELSDALPDHPMAARDEVTNQIGKNVAQLIKDRDCLQMGIGVIPDAVLSFLTDRRDLGIHTEMFSDGVLNLVEAGAITNKYTKVRPGKIVTGFALGSRRLYDFVDDNPQVCFLDIAIVNDTSVIRKNDNVVSINSALQVDLTGQICADSLGSNIYSGVGGQMDFIRGAALSNGGRSVIALPSTAAGGRLSRIVLALTPASGVVTTRAHAHYVATEYGVVNLRGKSIKERAVALIAIAHPKFRCELTEQLEQLWGYRL